MQKIRKKILILQDDFPPDSKGGAGQVAYSLSKEYCKKGFEVLVFTTTRDRKHVGWKKEKGLLIFQVYSCYHPRWRNYVSLYNHNVVREFQKILEEWCPDVVHAHNIHTHISYFSLVIAHKEKVKVVFTLHDLMTVTAGKYAVSVEEMKQHMPVMAKISWWKEFRIQKKRYNPLRNILIKYILKYHCDTTVAVSFAHKKFLECNGVHVDEVVYNGIDLSALEAIRSPIKKQDTNSLFIVGGIHKGENETLNALIEIAKRDNNFKCYLYIAGQSILSGDFKHEQIKIIHLGRLKHNKLLHEMSRMDLILAPSVCFETFGLTVLEAVALQVPVLSSGTGGQVEILERQGGYLVNPFDTEVFADAISNILSNKLEYKFSKEGLCRFSLHAQTSEYLSIFFD